MRLTFDRDNSFQKDLRRRVDAFFTETGRRKRDCPEMYVKTAVILAGFALSYVLLVFVVDTWWLALPLSILLGLITAMIGFNIMHDGGHGAYSRSPLVNRIMATTLDMIGVSSYWWHWNHGVFHHTYTNVNGHDVDLGGGTIRRLSPQQRRRFFHRWQHLYMWPLYGFLSIKWQLQEDIRDILLGHIGGMPFPRPRGLDLAIVIGGKIVFLTLAFAIPMAFHSPWVVLAFYGAVSFTLGIALSVVFQLAHCVDNAAFPEPQSETRQLEHPFAVHQVETTVDFLRTNRVATWLLGGLNFQIEHHLFPRICHVNYPAISKLVEQTCLEHKIQYKVHTSLWEGLRSHGRWLRTMGMPEPAA